MAIVGHEHVQGHAHMHAYEHGKSMGMGKGMRMSMSMGMSMGMSMSMGMGMGMGMSTGKDKRMGEGVGQSTGAAGMRQALPLARRTSRAPTQGSQGKGHKANKSDGVVTSQRDNSPKGKSSDFESRSRGFESRQAGSAGAGPRSSVLGYFVHLKRHFFLSSLMFSNCPVALAWWSSTCHLYRNPTVWRPLVHSALTAHTERGARPRPRTARPAHRPHRCQRRASTAHQLVQLRCLHLRFFRRAICEASTLPGDRHPSRLHAKKENSKYSQSTVRVQCTLLGT
jgi:hypothetical protein